MTQKAVRTRPFVTVPVVLLAVLSPWVTCFHPKENGGDPFRLLDQGSPKASVFAGSHGHRQQHSVSGSLRSTTEHSLKWPRHPRTSGHPLTAVTSGGSPLNYSWPVKRMAEVAGDIILGGLMMVHEREDTKTCGVIMPQGGVQALEIMLYTIDWINRQSNFLPGIKLGAYILDDCDKDTYGLEQSVDFIKGSINTIDDVSYKCTDGSTPTIRQQVISGVIGAASSVTSIQVANLLRLFRIPQVSYFSTSPELSNKQRFEFFLRTVPSDTNQAQAMVEIIKKFNWTYVSVIYEESNYGIKAFEVLEDLLAQNNICLAVKEKLTKDSGVAVEEAYDNIVLKLLSKKRAKGVIVFGSDQEVAGVMRAIRRLNATGTFAWIGSDGWRSTLQPTRNTNRKAQLSRLSGDQFHFADNQDGPARYNILHFKQISPDNFAWVQVGQYEYGNLELDLDQVQFRFEDNHRRLASQQVPSSVCSLACGKGQAKKFLEGENCCWHCLNCSKYQVLISETQCSECPFGYLPNDEQTRCDSIPEDYMRVDSVYSYSALIFSSLGITATLYVISVFIKHQETPVVRASGRELCYVLLVGILMCYAMTFVIIMKPSDLVCGVQQAGIGFAFAVVYSSILVKTNRISRIFNAGKKSAKRPSFISPKSQLTICALMIFMQLIITVVWFAFSPPKAIHFYPTREDNQLTCEAVVKASHFIGFCYPIILIITCTIYAVLTRKIPEAFNESKYIGFTMYTTCIIWLAFVPIYFTTSNHVVLNLTTMCVAISLSSTVTLICLFTPKLYIILLHPEKNVRQSMMPTQKYNTVTTNHTSTNLTTTTTTIKVENSTQSEEYQMNEKLRSMASLNSTTTFGRVSCGTQTNEEELTCATNEDTLLLATRDKLNVNNLLR
ncbi:Metabotropic glutamate receptor [Halotydeus destructor]|nr:Metabotropic glutamate receptor [Halotydeus destructor]